jgi:predicted Ser/Thr protein kinase
MIGERDRPRTATAAVDAGAVRPSLNADEGWTAALPQLQVIPPGAQLVWESPFDSGRRVYATSEEIFKAVLHERQTTGRFRARDLAGEGAILNRLAGVAGVPRCGEHYRFPAGEVLVIERVAGRSLGASDSPLRALARLPQLFWLVVKLSRRGVVHGDLTPENVLIESRRRLWLIDFDQAHITTPGRALIANFIGGRVNDRRIETSVIGFTRRLLKRALPPAAVAFARRVRHGADAFDYRTVPPIAALPVNASDRLKTLRAAWIAGGESDANSPGAGVCYYALDVEGFRLPGERPWAPRWKDFSAAVDFRGARVMELGCNMGLLSTFALAEGGAAAAYGIDTDARILEANALVQQGFGVSYETRKLSFDDPHNWEAELSAFKPTIVTALSVLNWLRDKQRFVNFLGRFEQVLFEGHESAEVEATRLRSVGFRSVDLVTLSERGRPVLRARK